MFPDSILTLYRKVDHTPSQDGIFILYIVCFLLLYYYHQYVLIKMSVLQLTPVWFFSLVGLVTRDILSSQQLMGKGMCEAPLGFETWKSVFTLCWVRAFFFTSKRIKVGSPNQYSPILPNMHRSALGSKIGLQILILKT